MLQQRLTENDEGDDGAESSDPVDDPGAREPVVHQVAPQKCIAEEDVTTVQQTNQR